MTLAACAAWLLAPVAMADPLPDGFGGITVGMPWSEVEAAFRFESRDLPSSAWDGFVRDCGYRSVRLDAGKDEVLVQADDFTVTGVTLVSPLQQGSDLAAVADLVLRSYGEPVRATQRDALGRVTLDPSAVQYVMLEYEEPQPVVFSIAGAALWQYQVEVQHPQARWHLNRMLRCARDRERAANP